MMIWIFIFLAAWLIVLVLTLGFLRSISGADDRLEEMMRDRIASRHLDGLPAESATHFSERSTDPAPPTVPESTWDAPGEHQTPDRVDG